MLKSGGLLCPQPDCGMGIIPPTVENGMTEEECRKIQCIGGCGVCRPLINLLCRDLILWISLYARFNVIFHYSFGFSRTRVNNFLIVHT